ncbi:MAG: FHA domain-containing protein [Anaerolineae bacterium]|nr:FHA domain-containing protein [Anaerolineae bacterium]
MSQKNDAILELLSNFIHSRQTGMVRDMAWQQALKHASEIPLSTDEVMQLLSLAKSWEKREGYKYRYDDRESTQTEPIDKSKIRRLLSDETEATIGMVSLYEDQALEHSTYFDDQTQLMLSFESVAAPLKVYVPADKEVLIGRSTPATAMTPDIDLSMINGATYGVSRLHASLQQRNYTLIMTDLGSRNYTFVNGTRLHPHEIRVLKHGDEIRLATLTARISFLRP